MRKMYTKTFFSKVENSFEGERYINSNVRCVKRMENYI